MAIACLHLKHITADRSWQIIAGYPRRLKGQDIPLLARIAAVADAYEVMSNGCPYKKAMPREAIIAEFKNCSGAHFDPDLVNKLLSILTL